jgi:hypothetical protein
MGGICKGELRQWSRLVVTSLGWKRDEQVIEEKRDRVTPLFGEVDGCRTEIIKAVLVLAENEKLHIDGVTSERVDLAEQLREIRAKRDAEEAERAERERVAAEERARKEEAEAAREQYLSLERKKKEAEEAAREQYLSLERKKKEAEDAARAAQERARVRAACAVVYKNTADKKMGDLTVKEDQQVKACQALGLYPPR